MNTSDQKHTTNKKSDDFCLICQKQPSEIPLIVAAIVWLVLSASTGIGIAIDAKGHWQSTSFELSMVEFAGFSLALLLLFVLPRLGKSKKKESLPAKEEK